MKGDWRVGVTAGVIGGIAGALIWILIEIVLKIESHTLQVLVPGTVVGLVSSFSVAYLRKYFNKT